MKSAARTVAAARPAKRGVTVNLRASRAWRDLIDDAAALSEKSRTDFILEATRRRAEDVLLDRRLFLLDPRGYRAFVEALDRAPEPTPALRDLMRGKDPWR